MLSSDSAAPALQLARKEHGSQFQYHVNSLKFTSTNGSTTYSATVTGYDAEEIREFDINWRE